MTNEGMKIGCECGLAPLDEAEVRKYFLPSLRLAKNDDYTYNIMGCMIALICKKFGTRKETNA